MDDPEADALRLQTEVQTFKLHPSRSDRRPPPPVAALHIGRSQDRVLRRAYSHIGTGYTERSASAGAGRPGRWRDQILCCVLGRFARRACMMYVLTYQFQWGLFGARVVDHRSGDRMSWPYAWAGGVASCRLFESRAVRGIGCGWLGVTSVLSCKQYWFAMSQEV